MTLAYLGAGMALRLPGREFGYNAMSIVAVNLFCASVVYMHEKTSRTRFLEAALLREMVARDGLTGIQNRRMFDQYIHRAWHQAIREAKRVAVLLIDIDCFKDYNDRYGHQAGDECLRAVAVCLESTAHGGPWISSLGTAARSSRSFSTTRAANTSPRCWRGFNARSPN